MKNTNSNKTVTVKHKKSFANTRTGQIIDKGISSGVQVAGGLIASYIVYEVLQKIEDGKAEREVRRVMNQAKARYESMKNK